MIGHRRWVDPSEVDVKLSILALIMLALSCYGCCVTKDSTGASARSNPTSLVRLAVWDPGSEDSLVHLGNSYPIRFLDTERLGLARVYGVQVIVEGIWTVAFDVDGYEAQRIDDLVERHGEVLLVWRGQLAWSWTAGQIRALDKRYKMACYIRSSGLADRVEAEREALAIDRVHSLGVREGQPN